MTERKGGIEWRRRSDNSGAEYRRSKAGWEPLDLKKAIQSVNFRKNGETLI